MPWELQTVRNACFLDWKLVSLFFFLWQISPLTVAACWSSSLFIIIVVNRCYHTGETRVTGNLFENTGHRYVCSLKGIFPFRLKIQEFHSLWQPQWTKLAAFLWVIAFDARRTKHILLSFLCFLGILWYSLFSLWLLLIKGWLLPFPNKLNFV